MKKDRYGEELNNILDACLERIIRGETIEACLRDYPAFSAELEPLLRTALAVRSTVSVELRSEFRARARYEFQSALRGTLSHKQASFWGWLPRWGVVFSLILAVTMMGGGTVAAASYSMPDSPLYPVKLATEEVRLMLPASNVTKAELCVELMERRVNEIVYLANRGDHRELADLTERLDRRFIKLAVLTQGLGLTEDAENSPAQEEAPALRSAGTPTETPSLVAPSAPPQAAPASDALKATASMKATLRPEIGKLKTKLSKYAVSHPAQLEKALEKAPESVRADIMEAIRVTNSGYERALKCLK
ncbi:MAG: DUF5667 domain-containing protein [Chloroflexota bacterium]